MSAVIFRNAEQSYLQWLAANPDGYVLTTSISAPATYMSLHRATCHSISEYMSNMEPGAFTERSYFKICSTDTESLRVWIKSKGGTDFTTVCSKCKPVISGSRLTLPSPVDFGSEVSKACADSAANRRARLAVADKRPQFRVVSTVLFQRNPDVVAEVLERANGFCEACEKSAPFERRSDHSPYLEVHHVIKLADGGEDSVENAIAVCPNCHRKFHFGSDDA
jgi:5-methylcytosine-specific restriction endonuclease McrA